MTVQRGGGCVGVEGRWSLLHPHGSPQTGPIEADFMVCAAIREEESLCSVGRRSREEAFVHFTAHTH